MSVSNATPSAIPTAIPSDTLGLDITSSGIVLHTTPDCSFTPETFFALCAANPLYQLEMNTTGEISIKMPTGGESGSRNLKLAGTFYIWMLQNDTGRGFDSSTGFTLPGNSVRSPDLSWVKKERWDTLTTEQKNKFIPLCPDFAVEIRSDTDSLVELKSKMEEYKEKGTLLGVLIDPKNKTVFLYRPDKEVEVLENPTFISCDPEMPGLAFPANIFWEE
jgi:Uma2 family endonuclease